jgi:hypothetical protein
MNKSLRGGGAESSRKTYYGFQLLVIPAARALRKIDEVNFVAERANPESGHGARRWIPGPREDACPQTRNCASGNDGARKCDDATP